MDDTSPASLRRYHELLAALGPAGRAAQCARLTTASREFALAGIRREFPDASVAEQRAILAERLYGDEIARKHFGAKARDGS